MLFLQPAFVRVIGIAALCFQAAAPAGCLMSIYANQDVDRSTVLQDCTRQIGCCIMLSMRKWQWCD
jgi:hypothetical protein